ncbi:GyrI-like domain-containing protein [Aquimarina sp. 2304DJ70-9]|uniref:GyrI-like domain-containing protein n=1 Tax=Aquimarina penaris TaxID=3231044 RepID=UPI003462C1AF
MQPRIESLQEIKLIGNRLKMSVSKNRAKELWQSFMPKRAEIKNRIDSKFYSIEVYDDVGYFESFNPNREYEKWAAIKVNDFHFVPKGMESIKIPEGLYAVFIYIGKASEAFETYEYIYSEWVPNSDYVIDNRPHFALMGEKYKNEDPNSEEELWIPIQKKS